MTHALSIKCLDHVVIRTEKMSEMLRFYEYVLGCPIERSVEAIGLHQLRAGTSLIDLIDIKRTPGELGLKGGPPPSDDGRNMDHLCLRIDPWDEAAIRRHLESHGVAAGPTEQRYGAEGSGPSIYTQDPDDNTIELKGPPTG